MSLRIIAPKKPEQPSDQPPKKKSYGVLLGVSFGIAGFLVGSIVWQAGFNKGNAPYVALREQVEEKAHTCHVLRNMGYNAWAYTVTDLGMPVPIKECDKLYELLGEKEAALDPQAKTLEDQAKAENDAKVKAYEAKLKAKQEAER